MNNQTFKIREFLPDDSEFILKTWANEIERTKPRFQDGHSAFPKRLFFDNYQAKVIVPLMKRAHARIVCPTNDITFIAHFSVANVFLRTSVVHFAYTRPPFRRMGLALAALEHMGHTNDKEIVATHWTKYMNRFTRPDLIYNDLVLYGVSI